MDGPLVFNVLSLFVAGIFTFIAVFLGGFSLYLVHIYRKFEHIPSPPRKGFFLGHVQIIREMIKTEGFFAAAFLKWCEELGDTFVLFTLGKPMLITINQAALKAILTNSKHLKSKLAYSEIAKLYGERFIGRGLVTEMDHDIWSKRRTALNPAFHRQFLKQVMNDFNDTADDLMESLAKRADGKSYITLLDDFNRVTLEAIAKVGFGMDISGGNEHTNPFKAAIYTALKGFSLSTKSVFRKNIPFLDREMKRDVKKAIRFLRDTGRKVLEERQRAIAAGDVVPKDILSFVIEAKEADPMIDIETYLDDFVTFFIAGQETTANTLAFAVREVGRHPAIFKRLREEIDTVIGERTILTFEDINKLEYISMIIKETLRLFPPVALTFRDLATDFDIGGYMVPKGTVTVLSTYVASRCSRTGAPDPLTFDPDRFSVGSPRRPETYTYFPFSLGPRNCIGLTFAQIEAKLLMAKFIQRFDFDLDPNQSFKIEENTTLRPEDGTRAALRLRDT